MTFFYICSNNGDDSKSGDFDSPFKTIQHAASLAVPGDSILVKPGIYRERISPINSGTRKKPIIYKSIEKNQAIVRGSIPWKPSEFINNISSGKIDSTLFPDSSHVDGSNPFLIPLSVTPFKRNGKPESLMREVTSSDPNMTYCLGQVFVNDLLFKQCPYKNEMTETNNSWFFDNNDNTLYINGASENDNIEITNQRRLFAPHKRGLKYIFVDGFTFERCANQYPNKFWNIKENQQAGAVGTRSGKYWCIKNNIIRFANSIGIDWGNEGKTSQDLEIGSNGKAGGTYKNIIQNNIICDNGAAGTAAYMANRFEFTNNIVERNNNLLFYGKQRWESAGLKVHRPKNSTISHNIVRNNYCHGIWSDQGPGVGSLFSNNIILDNDGNGIDFEIGRKHKAIVTNNFFDNNENNIRFATSGGVLIQNNTFINSRSSDIQTIIFKRPDKWDSLNVEIFYNLFLHSPQFLQLSPTDYTPKFLASRFFNYNTYFMNPKDKKFQVIYDYKTRISMDFDSWKEIFKDFNKNENFDDKSLLLSPNDVQSSISFENNKYSYNIDIKNDLPSFDVTNKLIVKTDYFSKEFDNKCISGAIQNLQKHNNKFIL